MEKLKELADAMRGKQGIEAHSAISEGQRVEYIRGQDLVAHIKEHPDKYSRFCSKGRPAEEQAKEVGELLLRRGLLRRCDHLYKKPPPGKKLAKYPRKLVFFHTAEALNFGEESFYAWTYDRPMSPWVYAGAGLAVVAALLASLFPLAPYSVKVAVLYLSAGLLMAIVALIIVRGILAGLAWVVTGRAVWILPNIMAEVPLSELFKPMVSVEARDTESWGSHPLTRLGVGLAMAGLVYLLYTHSPDAGSVAREASKYRDEIFDLLNVHREGYQRITGDVASAEDLAAAAAAAAAANDTQGAGAAEEAGAGAATGAEFEGGAAAGGGAEEL